MGKFPGKPSKIVNRRRIKVSKCASLKDDDSVKAAETIYHALTVFNATFGNEEQDETEFLGFSRKEIQLAVTHARLHLRDTEEECKLNGIDLSLEKSFSEEFSRIKLHCTPPRKTSTKNKKKQCFDGGGNSVQGPSKSKVDSSEKKTSKISKKQCFDGGGSGDDYPLEEHVGDEPKQTEKLCSGKKYLSSHNSGNTANLKNNAAKKLLQKAMKACNIPFANSDGLMQDKGVNGALRKFVLPSRSAHSSRVIKPNKRFIDIENTDELHTVQTAGSVDFKRPKLVASPDKASEEAQCAQNTYVFGENLSQKDGGSNNFGCLGFDTPGSASGAGESSSNGEKLIVEGKRRWKPSYKVQLKLRELNVFGAGTSRFNFQRNLNSSTDASESVNSGSDKDTVTQSTSEQIVDRSECNGFMTSFVVDSKTNNNNNNARVPGSKLSTSSKIILKEARLKLKTQTSSLSDGPFSNSMHIGASLPETVECGVCGAVRFYRFVKQARKFGIFSCESCRKFISKMIRSAKIGNLSTLKCLKGEGMCSVPPIVRSQQWKARRGTLVRCSYKARCPACWLKMCLRSFKMPDTTRTNLISMLPIEMQNGFMQSQNPVQCSSLPSTEDLTNGFLNRPFKLGFSDLPVVSNKCLPKEWPTPVPVLFQRDPFAHLKNCAPKTKQIEPSPEKQRNKKKNQKQQSTSQDNKNVVPICLSKTGKRSSKNFSVKRDVMLDGNMKKKKKKSNKTKIAQKDGPQSNSGHMWSNHRQRLELKGPRVKHVCRSASIVLGQVPATFPVDSLSTESKNKQKPDAVKGKSKMSQGFDSKIMDSLMTKQNNSEKQSGTRASSVNGDTSKNTSAPASDVKFEVVKKSNIDDVTVSNLDEPALQSFPSQSCRKLGSKQLPSTRNLPIPGKRSSPEALNQVSIDFWESYDPEEVCHTGFGLIGSEPFHVRAICFLCGSGGLEQLIHCASCCEPYHRFCLEDGLRDSSDEWRYNWTCQRCTVCHTCGRGQGQQLSCQRCHKTYHTECLGSSRLHSPDRPWVCPSCLRCKSCGATEVTVFVGNLPLCKACFKLRQKGNYCPLCQRCYEDHDYDTKMMECAKCSCWVHAKCEGLSDEKYQVLSYLPDSVEFVCKMCYAAAPAPWWIAVEEELKAGYLSVLKSLSKNRKACALLKSSPKKQCSCRMLLGGKQLNFGDSLDVKEPSLVKVKRECLEKDVNSINDGSKSQTSTTTSINDTPTSHVNEDPVNCVSNLHVPTDTLVPSARNEIFTKVDDKLSDDIKHLSNESTTSEELLIKKCNSETNLSTAPETIEIQQNNLDQEQSCPSLLTVPECYSQESSPKSTVFADPALKLYWEKYNIRECSVRVQDILPKPSPKTLLPVKVEVPCHDLLQEVAFGYSGKSPHKILPASLSTPCSDSGISSTDEEVKPCIAIESPKEVTPIDSTISEIQTSNAEVTENGYSSSNGEENPVSESEGAASEISNDICVDKTCHCLEVTQSKPSLTLLSVKKKVNASEYSSLLQFHQEMENLISRSDSDELLDTYRHSLQEVFPWFDPKYARVSSRPMHEDHFYCLSPSKLLSIDTCDNSFTDDNKLLNDSAKDNFGHKLANLLADKDKDYYYSGSCVSDLRVCVLCKGIGDGHSTDEGRLLYCGQNEWAHTNCALWSAEVFEEIDGSLQNVHSAVSRGRMIRCPWCEKRGASVGCCARNCNETYHFPCARKARCTFMDDKNVYCPNHAKDASGKILKLDTEFDVRRPIYVELDRKKKKFCNFQSVKFMIGSLLVESLGEFVSGASDHPDIILPNGFRCTRYFWSSVEPWRVVQYQVKTIVRQQLPEQAEDLGWNITIDHSLDKEIVDQKLEELAYWQKEVMCFQGKKINIAPLRCSSGENTQNKSREKTLVSTIIKTVPRGNSEEDQIARQVVSYLLDSICNKEVDESCLVDPQNTADILPPELKDAIFEDLPHDILDGISMQDIFPKLMSYEDAVGLDIKSDGSCGSDVTRDGKDELADDDLAAEVDAINIMTREKKMDQSTMDLSSQPDNWFACDEQKDQVSNLVEDLFPPLFSKNIQKYGNRELKRSKSDGVTQSVSRKLAGSSRSQQRSCSLSWSCKLDGTAGSSNTKRRKGTRATSRGTDGVGSLTSEIIGSDRAYMLQELRLSESGLGSIPRTSTASASASSGEGMRELKMRLEGESSSAQIDRRKIGHPKEEGKENKWLLWHSKTQSRILQLDGTVDSSSGSEGGKSPKRIDDDDDDDDDGNGGNHHVHSYMSPVSRRIIPLKVMGKDGDDEPVRCSRCHRTYRTRTSFERHLPTCSSDFILSTSESDSETTRSSEEESPKQTFVEDSLEYINEERGSSIPKGNNIPLPSLPKFHISTESQDIAVKNSCISSIPISPQPTVVENLDAKCRPFSPSITKSEIEVTKEVPIITPVHILPTMTTVVDSENLAGRSQQTTQVAQTTSMKSATPVTASSTRLPHSPPVRNRGASRSRVRGSKGATIQRQTTRNLNCQNVSAANSTPAPAPGAHNQFQVHMMHNPCAQAATQPTVFVQQVPSPSVVPAFVEAFQQHTGQSLQYIATIDAHSKHPFITSAPGAIVPGTFQIQASPDGFTGMQSGSIPVLPSVQINPPQPTVLGTLIPQPQPTAIQCGVVAAEQMVLGSSPGVEVYTDQNGGMFVASQPMFIGLETIVSNTVMQSQQIVSSTLPGVMAASSSFSATTTQVFQASKLEPIVDVPSGFVIVNPQANLSDGGIGNHEVVTCTPPHVSMTLTPHISPQPPPLVTHATPITTPVSAINPIPIAASVAAATALPTSMPVSLMPATLPVSSTAIPTSSSIPIVSPSLSAACISAPLSVPSTVSITSIAPMSSLVLPTVPITTITSSCVVTPTCSTSQTPVIVPVSAPLPTRVCAQSSQSTRSVSPPERYQQSQVTVSVARPADVSKQQNLPWRYTQEVSSDNKTYIPLRRHCPPSATQVPVSDIQNNCSVPISSPSPVSKTVVTVSSVPAPLTISSHQSNSPLRVVKTVSTVCSTVPSHQTTHQNVDTQFAKPPQISHKSVQINEVVPQQPNIAIQKVTIQSESKLVPIVNNKNVSQNLKSNTLKLVLQKQPQDGLYKVTPNQNIRILSTSKQIPVTKNGKPKPRPVPVVDKSSEQENHFLPSVLQPSQTNKNVSVNTVNGAKHIANGKLSYLKDSCQAKDVSPSVIFELRSQDGFSYTSTDITEVWQKVFEAVQQARASHKMPPLPQNPFLTTQDGLQMLGLKHNGLRYLVEQLPGAGRCIKYKPRYHKQHPPSPEEDVDALPPENKTGSARSQPFAKRSPYDMFSWLASRHRQPPKFIVNPDGESISNRRATSSNLPMAMRFRHLKETSKEAVGVYRSHIHGRGLFCLRDIDAGEMVIEYAGEVIRSTLTDKREKLYESKGIGCYMFRIDDQLVVDATMRGNAARFINHSCEPNCYSRVVDILGKKHILIFALRRIPQGEELTYDYKFPFEDVKIPCTCGSRRCRKYLN